MSITFKISELLSNLGLKDPMERTNRRGQITLEVTDCLGNLCVLKVAYPDSTLGANDYDPIALRDRKTNYLGNNIEELAAGTRILVLAR